MWTDFGERQCGKTTRMMEHCVDYLLTTNERVVIVSPTRTMYHLALEVGLKIFANSKHCVTTQDYQDFKAMLNKRTRYSFKMEEYVRNYVDEAQLIKDKYLFEDHNSYYTATTMGPDGRITPFLIRFTRSYKIDALLN